MLGTIAANKAQINEVVAVAPQLESLRPYQAQVTALSKVPPSVLSYLQAHGNQVLHAQAVTGRQWKHWYWVCFGGVLFFLLCVPLLKGRWRPSAARRDEDEHEAMVQAELAKIAASGTGLTPAGPAAPAEPAPMESAPTESAPTERTE